MPGTALLQSLCRRHARRRTSAEEKRLRSELENRDRTIEDLQQDVRTKQEEIDTQKSINRIQKVEIETLAAAHARLKRELESDLAQQEAP